LKVEEMMGKVKLIREAAGMDSEGGELDLEEWKDLLEGDFSDEKWEEALQKKLFNEEGYYAQKGDKLPEKPEFDDDIDINDLVPDFEDESADDNDDEDGGVAVNGDDDGDGDDGTSARSKRLTRKDH